ncbi:hypothetical protein [Acetobacter fabarum]|uniref:hypothetical protein n=1 Tax=Acetobacter fabarum TaxID=483199 RepID=UPI0020A1BCC6|nr:hypothetical protein [Acetobacter fabarum]MCP1234842.1 hypothetical protein [Acetobacter fabarum]
MTTISQSEAARRAGVSRPAIKKAIDTGKIISRNGQVDIASFDEWLRLRMEVQPAPQPEVQPVAGDDATTCQPDTVSFLSADMMSRAEATRVREVYKAQTAKLEYDQKAGRVVEVELIARAVGAEYARVRTSLLAIPAEHAPALARCKTPAEVRERLETLINRVLEALTLDGPDATNSLSERP